MLTLFLAHVLGASGIQSIADVPVVPLIAKLGDDAFAVREAADKHLRDLGMLALPQLVKACRHPDPEVAKEALACGAALPESVTVALELLAHPRWDVRAAAARVLGSSGGASCLKAVAAALSVESDPVARKALDEAAQRLAER